MKILLIVNSDIGRSNTIGFRFGKIAAELKNRGIGFYILARANYSDFLVKTPFYKNYLARFFNALRIYLFPFLNFRRMDVWLFDKFVLNSLKKNSNFDLVHLGEYLPKSMEFLKSRGIKIFLDIPIGHYKYSQYLQERGFKQDFGAEKEYKFIDRAMKLSDCLIVPSEFVKKTLVMSGFSNKNISIIPFGVDLSNNFKSNDIEIKYNQEKRVKKIIYIFVGNVNYRKGINFLLEAWDKLDLEDAELLICGRVYRSIQKKIKKYKNKNVQFLGFVNAGSYLKQSHVFVFPTLLEGSAKSVYEAMSYGLPVITTENAGSIIEDRKSGFIVPIGDSDYLAEKMLYLHNNLVEAKKMGLYALNLIKGYSWQNYANKVLKCYQDFKYEQIQNNK